MGVAFDGSEGNDAVGKGTAARITPAESPFRFLLDAGNLLHGMEETPLFLGIIGSVHVNEERVGFVVNVLDHALKIVEAARFGELDLSREVFDKVFVDDAIRGGKESKDVLDEVLLGGLELIELSLVLAQIDLFRDPETGYICTACLYNCQ